MATVSLLPHAEFGPNDHREDTPHFMSIYITLFGNSITVFGYFCRTNLNFTLDLGQHAENHDPLLEKLSDIKGFEKIDAQKQDDLMKGDLKGVDGLELLMKFACLKSSIGIIKAILNIEKFETSFLRDLISLPQGGFQIDIDL